MKKRCQSIDPLLSAYADGELPEKERREVERHLDACPECRGGLQSVRLTCGLVRSALDRENRTEVNLHGVWEVIDSQLTDSPSLWEKIRRKLGKPMVWGPALAAAATLVVVLVTTPWDNADLSGRPVTVESVYSDTGNVLVLEAPETGKTIIWILPQHG